MDTHYIKLQNLMLLRKMDDTKGRKKKILNTRFNNPDALHIRSDISQILKSINNLKAQETLEVTPQEVGKDG